MTGHEGPNGERPGLRICICWRWRVEAAIAECAKEADQLVIRGLDGWLKNETEFIHRPHVGGPLKF